MSESSLSISPAIEPFAGGVIGLGLGYNMAPRKYTLKHLLVMNQDTFSKIYSDDLVKRLNKKEREAFASINRARAQYVASRAKNTPEIIDAAKNWAQQYRKVEIPQVMTDRFVQAKASLQNALQEENYIEIMKNFRTAKSKSQAKPDNNLLRQALTSANEALASANVRISGKMENYRNVVRNIRSEKLFEIKNNPEKWMDVKEAYKRFLTAVAQKRTKSSNKLFALSNDKNLLKSYEILKEYLPKARTKSALVGSVIFGTVSAIITSRISQARLSA